MKPPQKYKISELITELNIALKQYGDLPVEIYENNDTVIASSDEIEIRKHISNDYYKKETIRIYGHTNSF